MPVTYTDVVESVKRMTKWSVISGSFSEVDLMHYIQDGYVSVQVDYPDIVAYTFTISGTAAESSIAPAPDIVDKVLLATKGTILTLLAYGNEVAGDAILIRAGSISVDTSKSLAGFGFNLDRIENDYKDLVTNLRISGKTSDTTTKGIRVDNYIQRQGDIGNKDSESLI